MKTWALVLGCLFLPLQSVYYLDCCCGDFCAHKNACRGCEGDKLKDCDIHPGMQRSGDCCAGNASGRTSHHDHKKACSHVSPSSEIAREAVGPAPSVPVVSPTLVLVPLVPECAPLYQREYRLRQFLRTANDPPRHLLLSVLLI